MNISRGHNKTSRILETTPESLGMLSGDEAIYALGVSHLPKTEGIALVFTTQREAAFLLNRECVISATLIFQLQDCFPEQTHFGF